MCCVITGLGLGSCGYMSLWLREFGWMMPSSYTPFQELSWLKVSPFQHSSSHPIVGQCRGVAHLSGWFCRTSPALCGISLRFSRSVQAQPGSISSYQELIWRLFPPTPWPETSCRTPSTSGPVSSWIPRQLIVSNTRAADGTWSVLPEV